MPLYPGLLALFLLAPVQAPAQVAGLVQPVAPSAAAANLQRNPELASEFDRVLLLDAGYLIQRDGAVLDKGRKPVDEPALKLVLDALRAQRKEKTLADLEAVQEEFAKNGSLTPGQAERLRVALESGWPLVSEEVRAGFNELLSHSGNSGVYGPKLDWIQRAAKSWERDAPDGDSAAKSLDAYAVGRLGIMPPAAVPKSAASFWGGAYQDEFSPPPAAVVKARLAEVDKATWRDPKTGEYKPYAPEVQDALRVVMRYADARDGEAALRVLRELHPPIEIGNGKVPPFASGVARSPDVSNVGDVPSIGLMKNLIGYQRDPKTGEFKIMPSADPEYYKTLGLAVPSQLALDPAAKPQKTDKYPYYTEEIFADGSVRQTLTALGRAPILMHEIMHLDTYRIGAGEQAFSNEMRSMNAERRLIYNRDEARGMTAKGSYGEEWDWLRRPMDFRRGILASYSGKEIGEVRAGEETVEGQIRAKRALLASGNLEAWRTDAVNRGVDHDRDHDLSTVDLLEKTGLLGKVEAEQARERIAAAADVQRKKKLAEPADAAALLKEEMSRLQTDREQTLSVFLEDWRWHTERGLGTYAPEPAKPDSGQEMRPHGKN